MPRLFTGIEIPAHIGLHLSLLRGGLRGARWIDPENYHITLRFIGDIDPRGADEVAAALSHVRRAACRIQLAGLGCFGADKPHSIWVGMRTSPVLVELQAEHERILRRLGLVAERRKFCPHVTVARVKGIRSTDVALWLGQRGGFCTEPFLADRFVLFSSRASVGGGPYLIEEAYPLAA